MDKIKPNLSDFECITSKFHENNIRISELGFVITDKDYNKTLLASICIHMLDNLSIFDNAQYNNLMDVINYVSYG